MVWQSHTYIHKTFWSHPSPITFSYPTLTSSGTPGTLLCIISPPTFISFIFFLNDSLSFVSAVCISTGGGGGLLNHRQLTQCGGYTLGENDSFPNSHWWPIAPSLGGGASYVPPPSMLDYWHRSWALSENFNIWWTHWTLEQFREIMQGRCGQCRDTFPLCV